MYGDGRAWRAGPHRVYRRFAAAAVETLTPVGGQTAVDVGAGTGAMGEELAARGARVVYADRSLEMLRHAPVPRLACDVRALSIQSGWADLAAAGFVLSHVDDPAAALAELVRVIRPGGRVVATAFLAGHRHPVKEAVDEVLHAFGYQPPAWYLRLKETGEARVGDPAAFAKLGRDAGLRSVRLDQIEVSLSSLDGATVVAWRLGMSQVVPFLAQLPVRRREGLVDRARAVVMPAELAVPVPMLVLTGAAP
jgi:ubiquinone/menaquinone biosynthesis C-methylase UbiE